MKNNDILLLEIPNPRIEDILKRNFNLPEYVNSIIESNPKYIEIEKYIWNQDENESQEKKKDFLELLKQKYEIDVELIIWDYKEDFSKGKIKEDKYTKIIKELTKKYLKDIEDYKKSQNKQQDSDLQKERIKKFQNGEIELRNLYYEDLDYITIERGKKYLLKLKRYITANFREDNIKEMTLGELIQSSKGKTK